ncbi:hypothetical protein D3C75_669850 [compost metagenome]
MIIPVLITLWPVGQQVKVVFQVSDKLPVPVEADAARQVFFDFASGFPAEPLLPILQLRRSGDRMNAPQNFPGLPAQDILLRIRQLRQNRFRIFPIAPGKQRVDTLPLVAGAELHRLWHRHSQCSGLPHHVVFVFSAGAGRRIGNAQKKHSAVCRFGNKLFVAGPALLKRLHFHKPAFQACGFLHPTRLLNLVAISIIKLRTISLLIIPYCATGR